MTNKNNIQSIRKNNGPKTFRKLTQKDDEVMDNKNRDKSSNRGSKTDQQTDPDAFRKMRQEIWPAMDGHSIKPKYRTKE